MASGSVRTQESTQDLAAGGRAQQSMQDLAVAAQNPIAAMYSLPFRNNIYLPSLSTGPSEITEQSLFSGSHFGLGDINQTFFFSPAKAAELIWGVGPSFNLPTATATPLGSAKFSMGPSAIALTTPKPWVIGTLARQLWSVKGPSNRPDVSQFLLQPFVNYNMEEGWYLSSSPIITANWLAPSNKWALPIGAGIGKIFRIGDQPINASLQAFDYVLSPTGGPRWAVRAYLVFLFPRVSLRIASDRPPRSGPIPRKHNSWLSRSQWLSSDRPSAALAGPDACAAAKDSVSDSSRDAHGRGCEVCGPRPRPLRRGPSSVKCCRGSPRGNFPIAASQPRAASAHCQPRSPGSRSSTGSLPGSAPALALALPLHQRAPREPPWRGG